MQCYADTRIPSLSHPFKDLLGCMPGVMRFVAAVLVIASTAGANIITNDYNMLMKQELCNIAVTICCYDIMTERDMCNIANACVMKMR